MVHSVHDKDPEKSAFRTYKTLDPVGEIALVPRSKGMFKVVIYTGKGENQKEHCAITLDHRAAFDFAMDLLKQAYRVGDAP